MRRLLRTFFRDDRGQAAFEYALLLAVVGGGIALGSAFLGEAIGNALTGGGEEIAKADD